MESKKETKKSIEVPPRGDVVVAKRGKELSFHSEEKLKEEM